MARVTRSGQLTTRAGPYAGLAALVATNRSRLGMSQAELADRVGTSISAVSRLESGQHRPNLETLERIGRVFGLRLVVGFEDDARQREVVAVGRPTDWSDIGYAQAEAGRAEIRRLISLTDRQRESYFLRSNRNVLRLLADARQAL